MDIHHSENDRKNWAAPFFTIWGGQAFSLLGSQLVQFALIWWMTKATGSAIVLTTAALVGLLPQIFVGPIAGAAVDRWNRRRVMIVADCFIALATLGLAILFLTGWIQIWHVYVVMAIRSVAGGFHWPAMQASTSLMVPNQHLTRVQGINQVLEGFMTIGAAPLGALLIGILPMQGVLAIDIGTAVLAITSLAIIPVPQPKRELVPEIAGNKITLWQDLRGGLRYVRSWPGLILILAVAALINLLLGPAFALLPLLITGHFGGGALQLASMESAWGIGMVLGALLLSAWGGFRRRILTTLVGLLALGLGSLVIGLAPASAFLWAVGAMFVLGFTSPMVNGPILAIIQGAVAPEMQGRVFTLMTSLGSAMTPLGLIIAGPVAEFLGVQVWFIAGGIITFLIGVMGFVVPAVAYIEKERIEASPADPKLLEEKPAALKVGSGN